MVEPGNITTVLMDLIQPFAGEGPSVTIDTDLVDELGLTSLQVMEFIETVEDRYDISYPLNELAEVRTLRDLSRGIERQLRQ